MSTPQAPSGFGTACVKMRGDTGKVVRSHREAIYPTTAFTYNSTEEAMALFNDHDQGYIYSRWSNPTTEAAANALSALEMHGSSEQAHGLLFGTGMGAISAALQACLPPGAMLITQPQLYGGTEELIRSILVPKGLQRKVVDLNDESALNEALAAAPTPSHENSAAFANCRGVIYAETPSNPTLDCVDLAKVAALAHANDFLLLVDNTFATPFLQQPLLLGADLSIYSTTKFLNGHGNALGGAIVGRNKELVRGPVFQYLKLIGGNASPFDAWLLLNGLKTLEIRMERHCNNAELVANWLTEHSAVSTVNYPGLKHNPHRAIAAKQMKRFGAMLSFELKGGLEAGVNCMNKVQVCVLATTLGTVDTLIQHPASMTHVGIPREDRLKMGISDGLIRLSVGIENHEDLMNDLNQAFSG